ncbi:MAG: arsenosugar biosynthesis arsenite methyltransferase ArsM [Gemmataceae bacterium]
MTNYLQTVKEVYAEAAQHPDDGLCCTQSPVWRLPGLHIPPIMLQMNYGCGSTVNPHDLGGEDTILYVGVGGGLESLQFAYFARRAGGVIAVDPVAEMRAKARANFFEAAKLNSWFRPEFVTLLDGSALSLPVGDSGATVVAQNCLFNIFTSEDLAQALSEVVRVLRPGGKFITSDPITHQPLPVDFAADAMQRARCLSGCQTLPDYLTALTQAGFGRVEVRARFPYRYLHPREFPALKEPVLLESIEVAAFKVPDGLDGPAIFTGRTAIYTGSKEAYEAAEGVPLPRGFPVAVSDAAAKRLQLHPDILVTAPTFHAKGGGCC